LFIARLANLYQSFSEQLAVAIGEKQF